MKGMVTNMYKYISKTTRTLFNVVLILVFFIPFYWMAITSIKTLGETLAFPPKFWVTNPQWENFQTALESIKFWDALKNSIIVTIGILVFQVVTIVPAAYAFARYEFVGKKLSFGIVLATMMIPAQLVFLPIFLLLTQLSH